MPTSYTPAHPDAPNLRQGASSLVWLALAIVFAMSVWFSASAVAPELTARWQLSVSAAAWLTLAVQLGFVFGTLASAILNLADRVPAIRLFAFSAIAAALLNLLVGLDASSYGLALALRFGTGSALAGVYPPGMKIATTWFRERRGLAVGTIVAATTLGSAVPQFLAGVATAVPARVLTLSSILAALGAVAVLAFVREGPYATPAPRFRPAYIYEVFKDAPVRLAIFGYLGHMWELYAFWTWLPAFSLASLAESSTAITATTAAWLAFLAIGVGAVGSLLAGVLADRFGRTTVTTAALIISGLSCIGACLSFGQSPLWLVLVLAIWGVSVVADSAQFSAAVTELADPAYSGTALTLQTSLGFLLTFGSIRLVPILASSIGWRWAMLPLIFGPLFGITSMVKLRALPGAMRMAGGRR